MKKGFCKRLTGVILGAVFCAGTLAQASPELNDKNQKKEPVQIIVVDKVDRVSRAVVANDKSRVPQVRGFSSNTRKDANQ